MKIRIEADSPDELREKGDALLRKLAKALSGSSPEVAEALEKARSKLPPKEPALKHQALRDVADQMHARYQTMLDQMLGEIGRALDDHATGLSKAGPDYTEGIIQLEQASYDRAKDQLALFGYQASDFEEGGKLYGLSTNDLRELLKQLQAQKVG